MELAESIKVQGILQPIVARKITEGKYQIIAGERRWRAAQLAGLTEVPVILRSTDDQKSLELALLENIQRSDLNPMEEALAYSQLMKDYGLTQQQVAEKVGKDRVTVANLLRLLNLSKEVQSDVAEGRISLGIAKVLLSLTDPKKQKLVAKKAISGGLSVRATEALVKKELNSHRDHLSQVDVAKKMAAGVSEELQKILGTKVALDYKNGRGKLVIHFYSDEEFNKIVDHIKR